MTATSTLLPPTAPAAAWNWRAELDSLESSLDHVAAGQRWDWRHDLRSLETELDQLAQRLGL